MRYLAYRDGGRDVIGLVDGNVVREITDVDNFYVDPVRWGPEHAGGPELDRASLTEIPAIPRTARILCVGLNYPLHIAETKSERPEFPNIFARWYSGLSVHGATVGLPTGEPGLDWEVELATIVGRPMRDVDADDVMANILGYTAFNDLSARRFQRATTQWALGKNAEGSGPIGPEVVTADEIADPYNLQISTRVNGEVMQDDNTGSMLFSIGEALSYASRSFELQPGDVLATGTPSGVGSRMDPPKFLVAGDICEVEIEQIGVLTTHFA